MASINRLWDGSTSEVPMYREDGASVHQLPNGQKFTIDPPPAGTLKSETPASVVIAAVEAHNKLARLVFETTNDLNLSSTGRQNKLFEPQRLALFTIAMCAVQLKAFRDQVDQREERQYALPALNPTLAGDAIREWEARAWFDRQSPADQGRVLTAALKNNIEGEAFLAALLRGPMSSWDPKTVYVRDMWKKYRQDTNVTEFEAIEAQRQSADWAFGALALLASMVLQLCSTWGKPDVLGELLGAHPAIDRAGYEIFGYGEQDAATARRVLAADAAKV